MMALTEKILDLSHRTPCSHLPLAPQNADGALAAHTRVAVGTDSKDSVQFLRDELDALRRDHAKLQQAIFEAAQVQRRLCAPREHTWREFAIAGEIFPVRHLSGDFFKVMELGSALGVVLGDIAGKGLTAGIWQAHLMALIQRACRRHSNPADAVAEVNDELCRDDATPPLTALFYARIDPRTNELAYCNAGLPSPLLLRANKTLEELVQGGPMLGAMKNASFQSGTVSLNPADMLIAYSDGVTECRNRQDDEFEVDRLAAAGRSVHGVNASKALFSLLGTVLDFADTCSPHDDMTLLVIRRRDAITCGGPRSRRKDFSAPHARESSVSRPKNSDSGGHGFK